MPELSVVIVTLKTEDEIECLQAIDESDRNRIEVVIRDDEGICTARNKGILEATSDRILFLDDDAIPCEGCIDRVIKNLDNHAIVAGRVIDTGHPWVGKTVRHYDQGNQSKVTDTIVGCNMAFRKDVFESVGLFDEEIQWGHDEKELAARALSAYEIHYDPEMAVKHPYASDIRDYWKKQFRLGVADIYYWKKREKCIERNIIKKVFSPKEYLDYSLKGSTVKVPGGLIKSVGRIQGYLRLRTSGHVFE